MHLFRTSVFEQNQTARGIQGQAKLQNSGHSSTGRNLRAVAAVLLTLAAGMPSGFSQQPQAAPAATDKAASDLPAAPAPVLTEPLDLRTSSRDFSKPAARILTNPFGTFKGTSIPKASFANSVPVSYTHLDVYKRQIRGYHSTQSMQLENPYSLSSAQSFDLQS